MATRADIIERGYKALTGKGPGNFAAELAPDVDLVDHDQPGETREGRKAVVEYLQKLIKNEVDLSVTPQIKAVDGEVICLDRMDRKGDKHCCVDRFQFNEANQVTHIDICWLKPKP